MSDEQAVEAAGASSRSRRSRGPGPYFVLRVSLREIEPEIWRRVQVPGSFSLDDLHEVLQFAFGWLDYHLYEFRVGERRFEAPDPEAEGEDSTGVSLRDLGLKKGDLLRYVYDFGDHWVHDLVVEKVVRSGAREWGELPLLLGGERAGPPEDAGGPHGFMELLAALRDPEHPEHAEYREWVGPLYEPEQRFDPWQAGRNLMLAIAGGGGVGTASSGVCTGGARGAGAPRGAPTGACSRGKMRYHRSPRPEASLVRVV